MPPEAAEIQDTPQDDPNALTIIVEDGAAEGDPPADDGEPQSSPEAVKVATLMGWKPKDQWKGDTSKWRPAEAFLAEVPEILSRTRQQSGKMKSQLDQVAGLVAQLTKNQRQQVDAALDAALDLAVENGDVEAAKKIRAQIRETANPPAENPAVASFKERNATWFEVDDDATAYAAALDARLSQGKPITNPDAHMRRVEEGVKKAFPQLFEGAETSKKDEPRTRAPLVAGGGKVAPGRRAPGEATVADLTPSQRRAAEDMGVTFPDYVKALNKIAKQGATA